MTSKSKSIKVKKDKRTDEQDWTTKLMKWIKWKYKDSDVSFRAEVKVIKSGNYCYNSDGSFKKEMRNLLMKRNTEKFSDASAVLYGTAGPYDLVSVAGPSYFILHWKRRGNKRFYMIPAEVLNDFILETKPKSISEDTAKYLGMVCTLK